MSSDVIIATVCLYQPRLPSSPPRDFCCEMLLHILIYFRKVLSIMAVTEEARFQEGCSQKKRVWRHIKIKLERALGNHVV